MDRDYKTGKSDSVGIFSGYEVEHTPAYGKQTLFLARNDLTFEKIVELAEKVMLKQSTLVQIDLSCTIL